MKNILTLLLTICVLFGYSQTVPTQGPTYFNKYFRLPDVASKPSSITSANGQLSTNSNKISFYNGTIQQLIASEPWATAAFLPIANTITINGTSYALSTNPTVSLPVTSILGTTSQVNVANASGVYTLSLPQSISTSSSPTFATVNGSGISLNTSTGVSTDFLFKRNSFSRFRLRANSTTESGSNVGTDFQLSRFADDGTFVENTFTITRSTGAAVFANSVTAQSIIKSGGTSSQFLKADGSVDGTSYAPLASPTFTGTPTMPTGTIGVTQTAGNSTTALATTAFATTASNLKQNLVTLTTTGSGAATFNQSTGALNVPTGTGGTVTSFGKADGYGITSSVANSTTTPVHTVAADTTVLLPKANALTLAQLKTRLDGFVPVTRTVAGFALSSNITLGSMSVGYGLSGASYSGSSNNQWNADTTSAGALVSKVRLSNTIALYAKLSGGNNFTGNQNALGDISTTDGSTFNGALTSYSYAGPGQGSRLALSNRNTALSSTMYAATVQPDQSMQANVTLTLPKVTGTFATIGNTETFSNKTLTDPVLTGTASPTYAQGKLVYDTDNQALTFYNNDANVSLQIGQEAWIRVTNNTGSTIANGVAVYINGSSSGTPTIALAKADVAATAVGIGLTTESIANGATGYVTSLGIVNGLNTSAFSVGAVYISNTTAGGLTQTVPAVLGQYRYRVGFVSSVDATIGKIHVTPTIAVRVSEVTSTTTSGLSTATLNITYPSAQIGDRVLCGSIIAGGAIYTKFSASGWLMQSAPVNP